MTQDGNLMIDELLQKESPTRLEIEAVVANLDDYAYERNRKRVADGLKLRLPTLDQMRPKPAAKVKEGQGREICFDDPEPWLDVVDGADLLTSIRAIITRHLVAENSSIVAMTLWIANSYRIETADNMPLLTFHSPIKRCGKSTGIDLVSRLVPRPIATSSISSAALFRVVEKMTPTLLIDEADSIFKNFNDDSLRTIVNASFSRPAAFTVRCVGDNQEPKLFSTWCPKCLALIGNLPDTLADRSILIPMRRKTEGETVERLRSDRDLGFAILKRKLARWTSDHAEEMAALDPETPKGLNDRQSDCWRELLKIASFAGGSWPSLARNAAIEIEASHTDDDDGDAKGHLLSDLSSYFDAHPAEDKHSAADLVEHLISLDGTPWPEWRNGKPLTTNTLARLLKGFGIRSKDYRFPRGTCKGYAVADFKDTFSRYLPKKRDTQQNETKSMQVNTCDCCASVSVADSKRNNPQQGTLMNDPVALQQRNRDTSATETQHDNSLLSNDISENVAFEAEKQEWPEKVDAEIVCLMDRLKLLPEERRRYREFYGDDPQDLLRRLHRDLVARTIDPTLPAQTDTLGLEMPHNNGQHPHRETRK